jgi:hypothetical protein
MPLEVISAYATNQAANTRLTLFGEDSNVIRNFKSGSKAYLLQSWIESESNGQTSFGIIRSPRMHDNVNGIQYVSESISLGLYGKMQSMVAQDNLNLFTGVAVAQDEYDIHHHLIYYEDLPQAMGKYAKWDDIKDKLGQIMTLKHTITATDNTDYSAGEVITTDQDEFDALKDYAFLGFVSMTPGGDSCVFLRGHDTGNLRIGLPMLNTPRSCWELPFVQLAKRTELPVIPIINAANKDNTFIDTSSCESEGAQVLFSYWAQLQS